MNILICTLPWYSLYFMYLFTTKVALKKQLNSGTLFIYLVNIYLFIVEITKRF